MPLVCLGAAALASAEAARADCSQWQPLGHRPAADARPVTAEDLIELVGFGRPDAEAIGGPSPLAVSPDGTRVAVILQRADVLANAYCQALVEIDLTGRAPPAILDRGGDFLMTKFVVRNMVLPNGFPRLNTPAWSRDGRSIGYLRRDAGAIQLWVARAGGRPVQVTHAATDIEAWTWHPDGRSVLYATRPDALGAERAIDREGLNGWHYDERNAPNLGPRPQPPAPLARTVSRSDAVTGAVLPVGPADARLLDDANDATPGRRRAGAHGGIAWAEPASSSPLAPLQLRATNPMRARVACDGIACSGKITDIVWDLDKDTLTYVKREGWNARFTALYRWTPGRGRPRRLLSTDDVLSGCRAATGRLVCIREGASRPPRIVAIDPRTGISRTIFDANPGFRRLKLGSVRRLTWQNAIGLAVYGDLVLPPDYRPGITLPMVVVQYSSRGFLRGGTGNEYPIFLLAARGFAVLSVEHPPTFATALPTLKTYDAINAANLKDWAERRSINSALETGARLVIAKGIADPERIGITGLSDGASAVRFALINAHMFAAAAISSCCVDESSDSLAGPAWESYSRSIGYPRADPVDADFWRPYSLARNAGRIDTPLLMQLADREMLYALPAYTALKSHQQPVDLYSFPDEYHIKWQPAHRRAIYERNLDWFSFWLQHREDPVPAKAAQFSWWRALRAARATAPIAASAPSPPGP